MELKMALIGGAGSVLTALIWAGIGGAVLNMPRPPYLLFMAVSMMPLATAAAIRLTVLP